MKLLITGGSGQLGQMLARRLAQTRPDWQATLAGSNQLDIADPEAVKRRLGEGGYDCCINAAAYTQVDRAEQEVDLAYRINRQGARNLADACNRSGTVLIHLSTDFVFDGNASTPYTETDPAQPIGVYGASKLAGECEVMENATRHFVIRTSWLYSEYGGNFMKTMLRLAQQRPEVSVVYDQVGTPTYAGYLADALLTVAASGSTLFGLYHYSQEGVASWYDFARAIFDRLPTSPALHPIRSEAFPTPARRPAYSVLDKAKFRRAFNTEIKHWTTGVGQAFDRLIEPRAIQPE